MDHMNHMDYTHHIIKPWTFWWQMRRSSNNMFYVGARTIINRSFVMGIKRKLLLWLAAFALQQVCFPLERLGEYVIWYTGFRFVHEPNEMEDNIKINMLGFRKCLIRSCFGFSCVYLDNSQFILLRGQDPEDWQFWVSCKNNPAM